MQSKARDGESVPTSAEQNCEWDFRVQFYRGALKEAAEKVDFRCPVPKERA